MVRRFCALFLLLLLLAIAVPQAISQAPPPLADKLYWEAVALHTQDKAVEALAKIRAAVKQAPKHKLYLDYEAELEDLVALATLDQHAIKAPAAAEKSIQSLAEYLIKPAKTEREKVRLIWRWVTDRIAYDAESYFAGKDPDTSPEGVLKSRKTICDGYANIFQALAKAAGIDVVKIVGYAKGYGYRPGDKFKDTDHAWNAVKLDGRWLMIDSTWGAGNLSGKDFVKALDDYYFLTPPDLFVYSHLAEDPKLQFTKATVTKQQFESWPKVSSSLFTLGFSPDTIRGKLNEKNVRFVDTFNYKGARVKVLQAPLTPTLKAGDKLSIRVSAPGAMELLSINGKDFSKLASKDGIFEGTVAAKKGKLSISAKLPGKGTSYYPILIYQVN